MNRPYQICTNCIMDTTDPDIIFDESGVCNHCLTYQTELPKRVFRGDEAKLQLEVIAKEIKAAGRRKEYDCIIGVSGGIDSTYVAYLVKKLGLRPLAIHFDNGWNSELAVSNIEKTLNILGIELYTYVVDWNEFKNLQLAFLEASTPDGEVPTDHAINALLFREAARRNIRYIISGMNYATESTGVPAWAYGHMDWRYIRSINKIFGAGKLTSYPHLSFFQLAWWTLVRRIKSISILNYIEYNKEDAKALLENKLGWVYYGGKHYESVYTRFFQGYILPRKYNIDKRIIHLSDLIKSGQLSRDNALREMQHNEYLFGDMVKDDEQFVRKKLSLTDAEFQRLMELPNKSFSAYPNSFRFVTRLKKLVNQLRYRGLVSR